LLLFRHDRWNRVLRRALAALALLGLIAALPLAFARHQTESTANAVEIVFDYRDLLEVAAYRSKPAEYVQRRLMELKEAGVGSMAVYESTLRELELSGRVQTLSSAEAALLTEFRLAPAEKSTYVLFLGDASERLIRPLVESGFRRIGVEIAPWEYEGIPGLELAMPKEEALLQTLDPDPITLEELRAMGFRLVARLSDRRQPFDAETVEATLAFLAEHGVDRIVFDGTAVTGAADDAKKNSLAVMAELMNKHGMGAAAIELSNPQRGLAKLAHLTNYNIVRLHSLPANIANLPPNELADRFALAVQDRNIRMIFLNTSVALDANLGVRKDTVENIVKSLEGPDGAVARIRALGFDIGPAAPFAADGGLPRAAALILKAAVAAGAVALVALAAGVFFPKLTAAVFAAGLAASAALYVLSSELMAQALALGAAVAASTLAGVFAVRRAESAPAGKNPVGRAAALLLSASAISLAGAAYVVALLDHITYLYVLRQFRGVTLLHAAPLALAFAYVLFFHGEKDWRGAVRRIRDVLAARVTVLWVLLAAAAGAALAYYLSRTGNAGTATELERMFRAALQDTLGVRPRTKEFLFAHPAFVLGAYLAASGLRRKFGLLLIAFGTMGQLSIVDTFAHLHTPLVVSILRTFYGLVIGAALGLVLIGIWRLLEKGWARWKAVLEP